MMLAPFGSSIVDANDQTLTKVIDSDVRNKFRWTWLSESVTVGMTLIFHLPVLLNLHCRGRLSVRSAMTQSTMPQVGKEHMNALKGQRANMTISISAEEVVAVQPLAPADIRQVIPLCECVANSQVSRY